MTHTSTRKHTCPRLPAPGSINHESAADWYLRRPWTARYPDGVPAELAYEANGSMLSMLLTACDRYADRVAFELDGEELTFAQWRQRADDLARFFVHEWKLEVGDRILFLLPNLPAFPIALLAAWMAGVAVLPVYSVATSSEIEGIIAVVAPKAMVGLDALLPAFRAARGSDAVRELAVSAPALFAGAAPLRADCVPFDAAIARGANLRPVQRTVSASDLALMSFTGGTTGVAKAVMIGHGDMYPAIRMLSLAMSEYTRAEQGGLVISVHPFSHAAGMSVNLLQYASNGVTQMLFPKMIDAERVVAGWRGRAVHSILAGPAFYNRLMLTPGFAELDFSELRTGVTGGMALNADIRDRWQAMTGKPLLQGYGLTETSTPIVGEMSSNKKAGSVGVPFPSVELTIRDPHAPHHAVTPGECGEVWVRGPWLMSGYFQRPDETARAITQDGWFRTGDIGRMDADGFLWLLSRIKEMLLVDGANVYPSAVEDVVSTHPGIADACVVGMPDEEDGERVRLFVVRRDPNLDEATVATWCAQHLSHFKQPKRIEFVETLPRSAIGKVLRRELSARPLA